MLISYISLVWPYYLHNMCVRVCVLCVCGVCVCVVCVCVVCVCVCVCDTCVWYVCVWYVFSVCVVYVCRCVTLSLSYKGEEGALYLNVYPHVYSSAR